MKSTESSRWRVRAASPPGPLQGAWLSVTSARGPRASRRKAKAGPSVQELCDTPAPVGSRGKLQPDPKKRLDPTPHLLDRRRHRGLHPRGAGRATGAPSAAGFRCGSLGSLDVDVSGIQPFPFSLRPGKSSTPSPAMAKKVWATCWRKPTAAGKPGSSRPWMRP